MLNKYRVHEVAKDFKLPSKDVLQLLDQYKPDPNRKHMTVLEPAELDYVFEHYTQSNQVDSFDEYFSEAEANRATAKSQPAQPAQPAQQAQASTPQASPAQPQKQPAQTPQQAKPAAGGNRPAQGQARPAQNNNNQQRQGQGQGNRPAQGGAQNQNQNRRPQQQGAGQRPQQQGGRPGQPQQGQNQPAQQGAPTNQPAIQRSQGRTVDMRTTDVNIDKYNERYEKIAPTNLAAKDSGGPRKQKLNQRSAARRGGRPIMSRHEKEAEKMRRLELERQRRQRLEIEIPEEIVVGELALRLKVQAAEIIKRLMKAGIMAAVTDTIDYDTAAIVAMEIGAKVSREVLVTIEDRLFAAEEEQENNTHERPPVVVVMGHVDHGKTSLLDAIRNANVVDGEAGGITQHIGAYQVECGGKPITFLDTPGHAAFTSMRARGAQVTDIAVLVVAADDGIMPQTVEAINHAKAAGVATIVAINKMDKPAANLDKVKQEMTEHELIPEEWGGDIICVPVSAKTRQGIDTLLEMILLTAEVQELRATPDRMAKGAVIEAQMDTGRGPVATVLVQNGTLRTGDSIIAGTSVGRVRVMLDDHGKKIDSAGPSTPVEITGLAEVPAAGDVFNVVADERLAKELVDQRRHEAKEEQFKSYQKVTLDNLFTHIEEGELKELPIIVKADVQGSVEAVRQSLEKITNPEVRVRVIHGAVGAVNESDVMLANASNAIIVGFNVRPDQVAKENADRDGVEIRLYRIIYDAIEEVTNAMKGMLAPKFRDVDLGRAEVRSVYKISNVGTIAGCYVLDGKITRTANIRVVRDGIIIADDKLASLKRFKDDVKEVASGYECGMGLTKYADIKDGDVFEAYIIEEYRE